MSRHTRLAPATGVRESAVAAGGVGKLSIGHFDRAVRASASPRAGAGSHAARIHADATSRSCEVCGARALSDVLQAGLLVRTRSVVLARCFSTGDFV